MEWQPLRTLAHLQQFFVVFCVCADGKRTLSVPACGTCKLCTHLEFSIVPFSEVLFVVHFSSIRSLWFN